MKKKFFLLLVGFSFAAFLIPSYLPAQSSIFSYSPPSSPSFGIQKFSEKRDPPVFSLKELDGGMIGPGDLKGKPTLLIFWATWCPSCKEEIALLEKFSQGKRDKLAMYAVVIDGEKEKRVRQAVKETKFTIPVLLDLKERVARSFGVRMVPSIFLLNEEGMIVGLIVGQRDWSSPEAWSSMKELLHLH